jgi:hypothetical protein
LLESLTNEHAEAQIKMWRLEGRKDILGNLSKPETKEYKTL